MWGTKNLAETDKLPIIDEQKCDSNLRRKIFSIFYVIVIIVIICGICALHVLRIFTTVFMPKQQQNTTDFLFFKKIGDVHRIFVQSPTVGVGYLSVIELARGLNLHRSSGGVIVAGDGDETLRVTVNTVDGVLLINAGKSAPAITVELSLANDSAALSASGRVVFRYGRGCFAQLMGCEMKHIADMDACRVTIDTDEVLSTMSVSLRQSSIEFESAFANVAMYAGGYKGITKFSRTFVVHDPSTPETVVTITVLPATTVFQRRESTQMALTVTDDRENRGPRTMIWPKKLKITEDYANWENSLKFDDGDIEIYSKANDITVTGSLGKNPFGHLMSMGMREFHVSYATGCANFTIEGPWMRAICEATHKYVEVHTRFGELFVTANRVVEANDFAHTENLLFADLLTNYVNMTNGTETSPTPSGQRFWRSPLGTVALTDDKIMNITFSFANLTRTVDDSRELRVQLPLWNIDAAKHEDLLELSGREELDESAKLRSCHYTKVAYLGNVFEIDETRFVASSAKTSVVVEDQVAVVSAELAKMKIDPFPFYLVK